MMHGVFPKSCAVRTALKAKLLYTTPTPVGSKLPHRCVHYFSRMYESLMTEEIHSHDSALNCKSHKLMLYSGLIHPAHTGSYHLSPMALRSLNKLKRLVHEYMTDIGAQELSLSTISSAELWKKSGRWETAGSELFKLRDRHGINYCLGPTYEEVITSLVASQRSISHRKLPLMLYQITRKFRDEMAPKYGLLRGREFEMKDLYTFDSSEENARKTYEVVCQAYESLFQRLKLNCVKVVGNTGHIGGSMSHEYHIPADIGQDNLVTCDQCSFSSNEELVTNGDSACPECNGALTRTKGIEVAHSFLLGTKYSKVFKANFMQGVRDLALMEMGCFGIGVSRLLAASLEVCSTEEAIKWPQLLAPYQVCIVPQKDGYKSDVTFSLAECAYDSITRLVNMRDEVVIDDRTKFSIGKRVLQAERLGYPYIVTVGKPALEEIPKFELIILESGEKLFLEKNELVTFLSKVETVGV